MVKLVPVDDDPFAAAPAPAAQPAGARLVPVDEDPFAAAPQQAAPADQPWYVDALQAADDMARIGTDTVSFGYADKLASYLGGTPLEEERARTQAARDRAGWAGTALDVATAVAAGSGLANAGLTAGRLVPQGLKGAAGLGARSAAMGVDGAALGALSAAGHDQDVGTGALIGGAAGVGGNLAGEALSAGVNKVAGAFNKRPAIPEYDEIVKAADDAYRAADAAGVVYTPQALARVRQQAQQALTDKAFLPANEPRIKAVLDAIDTAGQGNVTLKGLDAVRRAASNAYDPANKASNAMISDIIDAVDDVVANPRAGDVLMGDPAAGAAALKTARDLYRRKAKLDTIETAALKAERRAGSTGSGGNIDNATRQNVRAILDSPSRSRGFTPDELAMMEVLVRGTSGQNLARKVGKLSPDGNGLMLAGHLLAGPATAGASLPVAAVGAGAKVIADRATPKNLAMVEELIRAGGQKSATTAAPNAVQRLAQAKREALARALMASGALVPLRGE